MGSVKLSFETVFFVLFFSFHHDFVRFILFPVHAMRGTLLITHCHSQWGCEFNVTGSSGDGPGAPSSIPVNLRLASAYVCVMMLRLLNLDFGWSKISSTSAYVASLFKNMRKKYTKWTESLTLRDNINNKNHTFSPCLTCWVTVWYKRVIHFCEEPNDI